MSRKKHTAKLMRWSSALFCTENVDNGFHPYKDHTEWLRLVDGNILQTLYFTSI